MKKNFNFQPTLHSETINIRPLNASDFDELFACASDKDIWAGHPQPDRYKLAVFEPYFKSLLESNACVVVIDKSSQKIIGVSKYYYLEENPDDIAIGFTFLVKEYWGGNTNFELKTLMIDYAFNTFETLWFHVGPTNIRSQKATQKIGAVFTGEESLNISGKHENWYCYRINKKDWNKNN